jgi:isopenicillin N synthase-like dioxygenase
MAEAPVSNVDQVFSNLMPPVFHIDEIKAPSEKLIKRLRENIKAVGAIRIRVPGAAKIQQQSLKQAKRFFDGRTHKKHLADGIQHFARIYGERAIVIETLVGELHISIANYLASERGWIRRGECPSKADKEYFQWGKQEGALSSSISRLKHNVWPADSEFIAAKVAMLNFHAGLHAALLPCIHHDFSGLEINRKKGKPCEVICRDTNYFPKEGRRADLSEMSGSVLLNSPHVDLSNGTMLSYARGLQIYRGRKYGFHDISHDEGNWHEVYWEGAHQDDLLFIIGLATEIQTRGDLRATWHRVVQYCDSPSERLSTVSFCNAGIDDVLSGGVSVVDSRRRYPEVHRITLPLIGNRGYISFL